MEQTNNNEDLITSLTARRAKLITELTNVDSQITKEKNRVFELFLKSNAWWQDPLTGFYYKATSRSEKDVAWHAGIVYTNIKKVSLKTRVACTTILEANAIKKLIKTNLSDADLKEMLKTEYNKYLSKTL